MDSSFAVMGIEDYQFCIAHRGLFNAFLAHLDIADKSTEILRTVDKLRKIGKDEVALQLARITGSTDKANQILSYIHKEDESESFLDTLDRLSALAGHEEVHTKRMRTIYAYLKAAGIAGHFVFDPSITRGLDYYTGIVYETFLTRLPHFGSVCSGGRYNDLASLYTKEKLPGVGSSIGLDRLLAALEELDSPIVQSTSSADAAILNTDAASFAYYDQLARNLRKAGVRVCVYLADKKLAAQYKWAENNAIPYAILVSKEEEEQNRFTLKNLVSRENHPNLTLQEALPILQRN